MKKYISISLLVLVLISSCSQAQEQALTTIIMMRHAEKMQDGSKDPKLTATGEARAQRLNLMLSSQDIAAIYSTPYERTRQTVDPLAKEKSIAVQEYDPMSQAFLAEIIALYPGKTVVISGHSNTIPGMVNELIGQRKYEQLAEDDYNDLFIVTLSTIGEGKELQLNY